MRRRMDCAPQTAIRKMLGKFLMGTRVSHQVCCCALQQYHRRCTPTINHMDSSIGCRCMLLYTLSTLPGHC
jgi:hypothetical protein